MKALEKDRARVDTRRPTPSPATSNATSPMSLLEAGPVVGRISTSRKLTRRYRNVLATAAAFVLLLALCRRRRAPGEAVRATKAERAQRAERDRAVAAEKQAKT